VANVINNLLDNADKYSPDKPEISVSTRNVSNGIEITVQDNGIGISKEARKQIFDKFLPRTYRQLARCQGFWTGLKLCQSHDDGTQGSGRG